MNKIIKKNGLNLLKIFRDPINFALILVFLVSFAIDIYILFLSKYGIGIDSYYYATQIRYFQENLKFASPDTSLTLYFLAFVSFLGDNIIATNKIAIAFISSIMILPAFTLGKKIYNKQVGFFFALFIVSNSLILNFKFEYVKNLGGIFVFLIFLNQLYSYIENSKSIKIKLKLFVILTIVLLTHKLMATLTIFMFLLTYFYKNQNKKIAIYIIGFVLFLFLGGFIFPNILHISDFERIGNLFTFLPSVIVYEYLNISQQSFVFKAEILLMFVSPILLFFVKDRLNRNSKLFVLSIFIFFIIINFPFFKFQINNLSYRLFILIFIPAGLFLSLSLSLIKNSSILIVFILIGFLLPYKYWSMNKLSNQFYTNYELYETIVSIIDLPVDSLLVAHQGFDYYYSYRTKKRSFHFLPEPKHKKRPTYRLAYAIKLDLLEKHLGKNILKEIQLLPGFYMLMKESLWQKFIGKLTEDEKRNILTFRNPHIYRNRYMLRNQKFRKGRS